MMCEACEFAPWSFRVRWPDGVEFQTCPSCAFAAAPEAEVVRDVDIAEAIGSLRWKPDVLVR